MMSEELEIQNKNNEEYSSPSQNNLKYDVSKDKIGSFDESKLRAGFHKALEKRPVASDQIEDAVQKIKDYVRKIGEREVNSQVLGKQVMAHLKELDQVAYVRYASVYQNFQDIKDFADEVSELSKD